MAVSRVECRCTKESECRAGSCCAMTGRQFTSTTEVAARNDARYHVNKRVTEMATNFGRINLPCTRKRGVVKYKPVV